MRQPKAKTLPVTEILLNHHEVEISVFFDWTEGACFSLHAVPGPAERGGPIMVACDSENQLHSKLLDETQVRPGAQLAYLVHEFGGMDYEPAGRVILQLHSRRCSLPNGLIIIDIPRGQVAAGYIHFVDEETLEARSEWRRKDEGEGDDVDEGEGEDENEEI
jgi:hypothetical protein